MKFLLKEFETLLVEAGTLVMGFRSLLIEEFETLLGVLGSFPASGLRSLVEGLESLLGWPLPLFDSMRPFSRGLALASSWS